MMQRDFMVLGFFLDAPLYSLVRVDILKGTEIMSLAFIDPILALLDKNGTCLCNNNIFIDATLNSPAQVDTFRY